MLYNKMEEIGYIKHCPKDLFPRNQILAKESSLIPTMNPSKNPAEKGLFALQAFDR